jgi:hypothetical protein
MKKKVPYVLCLAALILGACGEETRNGTLTLAGVNPVKIADKSGKTVEFYAGPAKVQFSGSSSGKFTVVVSQGDRKAEFSGKAPKNDGSWNVTVRGKDIGQPEDFASARSVEYYGQTWRQLRDGGPCGMNGRYEVEDTYQKCNEDWKVSFTDAGNGAAVGTFASRIDGDTCLIDSRQLWCRDNPMPPPYPRGGRWDRMDGTVQRLKDLSETGINFN